MEAICKCCGEKFEVNAVGRRREYCYKPECDRARRLDAVKRYEEKKKLGKTKSQKANDISIDPNTNETQVVYTKPVVIDEGFGDLIQLAREYGACRFNLIEKSKRINNEVSNADKIEQDLLHKLENVEELTQEEAINIAINLKENRNNRRIYKNLQFLIGSMLKNMGLRHPEKFVRNGIEIVKNAKYEPRVLEELFKEDDETNKE